MVADRPLAGQRRGVAPPETAATLSALFVYPIKSVRGVAVNEARVDALGLAGDRRFMVVDEHGVFISQRTEPRLALVAVELHGDQLAVSAPGMPPLEVPLRPSGPRHEVRVWHDAVAAVSAGERAAAWFSALLGAASELVWMPDQADRHINAKYGHARVSFADAFPFLLVCEGSLSDLNRRLTDPLPMDRFRPNLVVAGVPPYAEDGWRRVRIGSIAFAVAKPCTRCVITTTDQATGARGSEPLATLATYRRGAKGVEFGQNLVHEGGGVLRLGDAVTVLAAAAGRPTS